LADVVWQSKRQALLQGQAIIVFGICRKVSMAVWQMHARPCIARVVKAVGACASRQTVLLRCVQHKQRQGFHSSTSGAMEPVVDSSQALAGREQLIKAWHRWFPNDKSKCACDVPSWLEVLLRHLVARDMQMHMKPQITSCSLTVAAWLS
jgi:hypothetical protein